VNTTPGRRERKKAATRQAIADAALRLFLDRGYGKVGVREVAEAADVSLSTLFKHFPSKEALVFDEEAAHEAALVDVVRHRPEGATVVAALREHIRAHVGGRGQDPRMAEFRRLVEETPALRDYSARMALRHHTTLARAVAEETGRPEDDPASAALAYFALQVPVLVYGGPDPLTAADRAFDLLEHGWVALA